MAAIITRAGKGSPLTNAELDANFTNLDTGKLETAEKGAANGLASLDALGKLLSTQLPDTLPGKTFTGNVQVPSLEIAAPAGDATVTLSSVVGNYRSVSFRTSGVDRWFFGVNNVAEYGANAGSDFFIGAFQDDGSWGGNGLLINRATQSVQLPGGLNNTAIGQTTPNAGTFTTLNASGNVSVSKASPSLILDGSDDYAIVDFRSSGASVAYLDSGSWGIGLGTALANAPVIFTTGYGERARVTTTGLQGPIGQDTQYAGSFTTLNASNGVFSANANIVTLKYAADGGAGLLAWQNSSGTTLWDIGGGIVNTQDELAIRHQGALVAYFNAAGNLGLGTAASRGPLHLHTNSGASELHFTNANSGSTASDGLTIFLGATSGIDGAGVWYRENGPLRFATNSIERAQLSAGGNFGLAVTPNNWQAGTQALQGNGGALWFRGPQNGFEFVTNAYFDGSTWYRPGAGFASRMISQSGVFGWQVAGSDGAGTGVGFVEYMTLTNAGRLGVNTTTPQARISAGSGVGKKILAYDEGVPNQPQLGLGVDMSGGSYELTLFGGSPSGVNRGRISFGRIDTSNDAYTQYGAFDDSGNLLVGVTSGSYHIINKPQAAEGTQTLGLLSDGRTGAAATLVAYSVNGTGANAAAAALLVNHNTTTGRSIKASGTINASGADYAEYMRKASTCGVIAKGAIVGVNADGELTDKWAEAVSFVVKSTDPSYVGSDTWAAGLVRPEQPLRTEDDTDATFADKQAAYEQDLADFEIRLEATRQTVDRIAFAGQVPVNVYGAQVGDYILAVQDGDGIKGVAVSEDDLTFKQYIKAVGIVQNILSDGRANIRVKVV